MPPPSYVRFPRVPKAQHLTWAYVVPAEPLDPHQKELTWIFESKQMAKRVQVRLHAPLVSRTV